MIETISVVIPVFNGEKTIRQAISSAARNQGDVLSEIIVVDDGSTDRTLDVLRNFQTEVPVRVFYQEHMGPGVARNTALKQAYGDLIVFLDADDYLTPKALSRMQTCMQEYDANSCVAGTRQLLGNIPISAAIECWHEPNEEIINVWQDNFLVEITPGVRAKMFKRETLSGLEFAQAKWEDLAFIPAALATAKRIAILHEPVYNYRIHLNTTVKDFLFRCQVEDIFTSLDILKQNLQKVAVSDAQMQKYFSILTLHTVFRMQNVMAWLNVASIKKQQIIANLARQLSTRYPAWREDAVLSDSEFGYKDPFFRMMLQKLSKNYLN